MGSGETERLVAKPIDVNATACQAFKPIGWSKLDTRPTQDQAVEHNAAWVTLCKKRI